VKKSEEPGMKCLALFLVAFLLAVLVVFVFDFGIHVGGI